MSHADELSFARRTVSDKESYGSSKIDTGLERGWAGCEDRQNLYMNYPLEETRFSEEFCLETGQSKSGVSANWPFV